MKSVITAIVVYLAVYGAWTGVQMHRAM